MNALRNSIPQTACPDSTIAMALDPYRFVARTCARLGTDVFQTRLLLQRTICMLGKQAAELISDPARFVRSGAAPAALLETLLGRGGVQTLDGDAHRQRKAMLMSLMTPERVRDLSSITAQHLQARARIWELRRRVTLYPEMQEILTRAVCAWAGVPLERREVAQRTGQLAAMFDHAASFGLAHLWSRLARNRAERWSRDLIGQVRARRLWPSEETALSVIAWHRDPGGALLDPHTAAVELLNVLRPVVAVSVYVVLVALALHERPSQRERLSGDDDAFVAAFVDEVRRFYPLVPWIGARVARDFEWRGYRFPRGVRVLLDIHGTNHDCRTWEDPDCFRPERFLEKEVGAFEFIPQGFGDPYVHHRCAGEAITVELMKLAARFLSAGIRYEVPRQDLRLDWRRVPALPRSRFVMSHVTAAS